MKITVKEG